MWPFCRQIWGAAGRPTWRKLLAICGSSREFWHVAAFAWQSLDGYRDRMLGRQASLRSEPPRAAPAWGKFRSRACEVDQHDNRRDDRGRLIATSTVKGKGLPFGPIRDRRSQRAHADTSANPQLIELRLTVGVDGEMPGALRKE